MTTATQATDQISVDRADLEAVRADIDRAYEASALYSDEGRVPFDAFTGLASALGTIRRWLAPRQTGPVPA